MTHARPCVPGAARSSFFIATVAIAGCAGDAIVSRDTATERALARIEHVVVIYGENRSFDNLYGLFPGANGIAGATSEQILQRDRDGSLLRDASADVEVGRRDAGSGLWRIARQRPVPDRSAAHQPAARHATRDLVHRFYQNREQINGGKLDQYAAWSDAGGLVMGYYDG